MIFVFVYFAMCVKHANNALFSLDMWKSDLGKIHNLIPGNFLLTST